MGFEVESLWKAPAVNPVNHKARQLPLLNPYDKYGRVFFFSWFGFFIAFWSWYAFPPLTTVAIAQDLGLSDNDIATGNVLALVSTCIARLSAGYFCDIFGPRWTFVAILLLGCIPTAMAGLIQNAAGLIAIRCATGILGATFVPCEVWTTGFFDKNIVGAANAFAAGWGNAGGGITYFAMPAIYDSLVQDRGLSPHVAWRVTFIVPFILILTVAIAMILFGHDTPTGNWSARHRTVNQQLNTRDLFITNTRRKARMSHVSADVSSASDDQIELNKSTINGGDPNSEDIVGDILAAASWELVQEPTVKETSKAIVSVHTLALVVGYFCSFGGELTVLAILGALYYQKFPELGQTGTGNWASMFGLLNFIVRPIGGLVSDLIYRPTGSIWGRKAWFHFLQVIAAVFLMVIGFVDPHDKATMFGLVAGLACFLQAGNGALFAMVPHVFPAANGIISGVTGAFGTLGGVLFTLVARHYGTDYEMTLRFMGIFIVSANVLISWISPIPRNQVGGR